MNGGDFANDTQVKYDESICHVSIRKVIGAQGITGIITEDVGDIVAPDIFEESRVVCYCKGRRTIWNTRRNERGYY